MNSQTVIEILTLTLKPGTRDRFHQLYVSESLPLQRKWKINVVAHGPSMHDENIYFVVRSFKSLEDRQTREDAFYAGDDWRKGPRTAILAEIDHLVDVVVPVDQLREWLERA